MPLIEGYGLTETSPAAMHQPARHRGLQRHHRPADPVDRGRASATTTATKCRSAQVGEICVRGPQVMKGYWNRPDETAKVFTADGWLRTGDMGIMDERGYVKIADRKKDMILVSGFNVYPNEIEDVVAMHPGVLESAAVGVPDDEVRRSGQALRRAQGPGADRRRSCSSTAANT